VCESQREPTPHPAQPNAPKRTHDTRETQQTGLARGALQAKPRAASKPLSLLRAMDPALRLAYSQSAGPSTLATLLTARHLAAADHGIRLLAHLTYHDSNSSNLGSSPSLKTSAAWRRFCYSVVVKQLQEMEARYTPFSHIDVVVDANEGNGFVEDLRDWSRANANAEHAHGPARVSVRVDVHKRQKLGHPFQLAWMHRAHMLKQLEEYDWFMSLEGDTFVPARAMLAQIRLAQPLYEQHHMLLGFVRLCNDTQNRSFYSDITKPASRSLAKVLPDLGITIVPPQNTYAAVWAYPRMVMRAFAQSDDWHGGALARRVAGMRERAAWGWRHYTGRIVTLVDDPSLRIYHVGKSGPYLVRVRGHNTLPADRLVA
jgi:hypothetical protein